MTVPETRIDQKLRAIVDFDRIPALEQMDEEIVILAETWPKIAEIQADDFHFESLPGPPNRRFPA